MSWWNRCILGLRPNRRRRLVSRAPSTGGLHARSNRRGRHRSVIWVLLALAGGWGLAVAVREGTPVVHSWLEIREVTVTGHSHLTQGEVIARLGLRPGDSLVSVRTAQLEARLTAHPWIKAASVRRVPFHTLSVHLTERQPAAVLESGTQMLLVGEDGQALATLSEPEETGLPILIGINPRQLLHGDERLRQVALVGIRLANLIEQSFLGRTEVDVSDPQNVVAYVRGLRFQFGSMPFRDKWDRYKKLEPALRANLGDRGNAVRNEIDLRYPDRVIVRERG